MVKFIKEVYCTLQVEGLHNWKDCPFDEVGFLRDNHRHVFHVKAHKTVSHNDRETEFIMLKQEIIHWFYANYYSVKYNLHVFESRSCEMLAEELINRFNLSRCEVSEDLENGSVVTVIEENSIDEVHVNE